MRKSYAIVVLALLLPILVASSKYASQPAVSKSFTLYNPNLASDPINYSIGVLPGEEYAWIITALRHENLELAFGSNWTEVFGLFGTPQRGYKFKANITSTQDNGTHYLLDYAEWDCLYRSTNFSVTPDRFCRYDYPIYPQNYTSDFELDCVFPLFLPIPLVSYVFDSNLTATYYDASDFTSYGGGLYVDYDRQVNISGYAINLKGAACYLENGTLDYFRFFYINGSEQVECLSVESFKPYHLEQTSMSRIAGEEFTWILVNYNLTVLEHFFGNEFFENYGLLPNPERMQSIKMKVDGVSENDTYWGVDYSVYNWTSLGDSVPDSAAKNGSYAFAKEPFNESRSSYGQIPFLIPEPTELFLRYGRFGDRYTAYYDLYSCIFLYFFQGEETLSGRVFYNRAGVLTSMVFSRSVQIDGRIELQLAFEIALYYDSPTPEYVGIEEGAVFNYDIYTNETLTPSISFPTQYYENATVEVIKVFGEEISFGRTPIIVNFSMQGDYNLWEVKDVLIVGYVHNDSNMYFDPLVISSLGPFYFAPLFVNNRMNWTEFILSYNGYSGIKNSIYYSVSEKPSGFNFHLRDFTKNITFSHKYNETGFLLEYTAYYNGQLYHNCSVGGTTSPPIVVDTDPPVITVISPSFGELFGIIPFEYNLTVEDEHLNSTWITVSDGSLSCTQEIPFDSDDTVVEISGHISESAWNLLSDGNLTVRFWANDSSGNLNWKEISVIKDATAPSVIILNLASNEVFNNTAPEFTLAIAEAHLSNTWYVVNGSEIAFFTGTSGAIDQSIWDSLSNGSVLVQFFAIDEAGNLGTAEVVLIKFISSDVPVPEESDDPTIPGITIPLTILQIISIIVVILIFIRKSKQKLF